MAIQNFEKVSRIRNVKKRRENISNKKLGQVLKSWKVWKYQIQNRESQRKYREKHKSENGKLIIKK